MAQTEAETLDSVIARLPVETRDFAREHQSRVLWMIQQVMENVPAGSRVVDLGAGILPFLPTCQRLGYRTVIIDDFNDAFYHDKGLAEVLDIYQKMDVEVIRADVLAEDFTIPYDDIFMVTSHDSIEHWHHSPKRLFHRLWDQLLPGGLFWIGAPNSVNLRKRLTVPFGYGKWSSMAEWYEQPVFRSHVREPDVRDFRYIARDIGASKYKIIGRNWLGYYHPNKVIQKVTPAIDMLLRPFPSLCSDLYLYAWK